MSFFDIERNQRGLAATRTGCQLYTQGYQLLSLYSG